MIYKYIMEVQDVFEVEMPLGMTPLHIDVQDGNIFLWANVWLQDPVVNRKFYCVGTGVPPPSRSQYVGTVVNPFGSSFVRHFWCEPAPEAPV